jgi:hypothetical protein
MVYLNSSYSPPPKFWKTMEIQANARKNQENSGRFIGKYRLNSGNFITILQKIRANFQLPPFPRKASALYSYVLGRHAITTYRVSIPKGTRHHAKNLRLTL